MILLITQTRDRKRRTLCSCDVAYNESISKFTDHMLYNHRKLHDENYDTRAIATVETMDAHVVYDRFL